MSNPVASPHPNLALLDRLGSVFPQDLAKAGDLFPDNFVFHYVNPQLSDLTGDYRGIEGLGQLFHQLAAITQGSFRTIDKKLLHVGDELVVTHATHQMTVGGRSFEVDAVVIWRIVDNKFVEGWDIPAVNTTRDLV